MPGVVQEQVLGDRGAKGGDGGGGGGAVGGGEVGGLAQQGTETLGSGVLEVAVVDGFFEDFIEKEGGLSKDLLVKYPEVVFHDLCQA